MSPTPNGSSVLQRFERGNALEIRNRIMFDFYPGLPQVFGILFIVPSIISEIEVTTRELLQLHGLFGDVAMVHKLCLS